MSEQTREPLLRVEFRRDSLRIADKPLDFVIHELGAIVERMPPELTADVNTANLIRVTIETF